MTRVEKIRAALAEAGYPDAKVTTDGEEVWVTLSGPRGVPHEACWLAFFVTGEASMCWPCWDAQDESCPHPPETWHVTAPRLQAAT